MSQAAGMLLGERTTLACPGDEAQYFCSTSVFGGITWHFGCSQQQLQPFTPGVSMYNNMSNVTLTCFGRSADRASFGMTISFAFSTSLAWSNLSISVLHKNYFVNNLYWLSIDCEDSGDHIYLNVTGKRMYS